MYYASLLERDIPGLSDRITEDTLMRWRRRVWRYLGWALDGGIVSPSTFSMSAMIQAMHSLPSGSKTRLVRARDWGAASLSHLAASHDHGPVQVGERVLDSVLHLKRPGKPYVWTPLMQQVVDVELMQDFELNDAAMVTMLSNNYIRDQLERHVAAPPSWVIELRSLSRRTRAAIRCSTLASWRACCGGRAATTAARAWRGRSASSLCSSPRPACAR